MNFPAHASEEDLEMSVAQGLLERTVRSKASGSPDVPTTAARRADKKAGLILDVLNDAGRLLDRMLGSTDGPAVNAVLSICLFLHPELVDKQ